MKLIPNYVRNHKNRSESKLFEIFKKADNLDDWVCLHSLGLSQHISKREGEIDFLLLGPLGIFVLEVKGGHIERKNGIWTIRDKFNRRYSKKESPFEQAKSALYSLKSNLEKNCHQAVKNCVFGYGVIFTDVKFELASPEWDGAIICNKDDLKKPIDSYLKRLADYWRKRGRVGRKLSKRQIGDLVNYLRCDFEMVKTIFDQTSESEESIVHMTNEQVKCLDLAGKNPRILLSGAAGTGKTMIAVEMLKRNQAKGKRTLFLCYNNLLAAHLRGLLKKDIGVKNYIIETLHSFMRQHINISDKQIDEATDKQDLFQTQFPSKFLENIKSRPIKRFDLLIIDEAQDIISEKYLEIINELVVGGIDSGNWLVCLDEKNQNIYSNSTIESINKIKRKAMLLELTTNCRNTVNIARQAELITGIDITDLRKAEGVPVKYVWYKNSKEQLRQVADLIKGFLKEGFAPRDITVLSPRKEASSLSGTGLKADFTMYKLEPYNLFEAGESSAIGYATIHAYKGLENKIIILTDIESIDEKKKLLNYVGFTRARSFLAVAVKNDQKGSYRIKLHLFLKKKRLEFKNRLSELIT